MVGGCEVEQEGGQGYLGWRGHLAAELLGGLVGDLMRDGDECGLGEFGGVVLDLLYVCLFHYHYVVIVFGQVSNGCYNIIPHLKIKTIQLTIHHNHPGIAKGPEQL
jgi:hypothetical protein